MKDHADKDTPIVKQKIETKKPQYWIRHQETGGVREITAEHWTREADHLRLEGYVLVDENGHTLPDPDPS